MKERNLYTYVLSLVAIYAVWETIIDFEISNWFFYLLLIGLVIVWDLFPVKLPSGIEYEAGSIGCLLILFQFGLSACMLSCIIGLLFAFWKNAKSFKKIKWFRYTVSIGMYYLSFLLAYKVMGYTAYLNPYIQAFAIASVFELANHILMAGVKKTVTGSVTTGEFFGPLKTLLIPVIMYTIILPRLMRHQEIQEWLDEISFLAIASITIIYFSSAFTKELTKRREAQEALYLAQQELEDTLRHQQGMTFKFKEADEKFIHTLYDGELMYRLGFVPEKVIGKELSNFVPIDMALKTESYYRRAWNGEENVIYEGELNGIIYLASLRPIKRNGKVVEVIGSCVDITERKQAEDLLLKSEKLAVAGQLAAGIAHEVRNPLTTIRGIIQLMQSGRMKEQYFDLIVSEIDRMNQIIRDFLSLAKPYSTSFKRTNLHSFLEDTVLLFTAEKIMRNVQIERDFSIDNPWILCEEAQLKQVFINIIKNAFEAMPNGGNLTISTHVSEPNLAVIRFSDSGLGIPEDRLDKLGEPFYSTKEKGTGLGLMVSYRIVEQHNGTIRIQSKLNVGTTVEVVLPLVK
ncbi:ATP-binding protein [Effusibacillus lacus]|uniref:histidine kinase n=1 Tax=Effusibacillus lacus TaxID=1348429 RepID=A0A292YT66_9BACL|nr:ATP-binding protein [Effusibacillus lacus]TCS75936.1 PAS domain S-box-containing protein [Effusibacillus lacus]GAX91675.1 hypothetical protein EFBL_3365 [Effusibacillus lacus]